MAQPTAYEQYMLELIDRARANPAAEAARQGIDLNAGLAAGTISTAAKQPLAFNPQLIDAALGHSNWMLQTDTFSHTGSGGSSPGDRMKAAGYSFTGSWSWGENIAIRWGSAVSITAQQVEALNSDLFKSAGHRENILNGSFREIGVGLAAGDYQGSPAATVTEDFAKSGTLPFLTGVAFDDKDGDNFYDPGEGLGGITVQVKSSTGVTYQTTTWTAGGYQIQLPAGTYQVTYAGGGLSAPVVKTATISSSNVKLDLEANTAPVGPPVSGLTLVGTSGADRLSGGVGNDTINAGAGNDMISAGTGNDVLQGGPGSDLLTGGLGADIFIYKSIADAGDVITDFSVSQGDRIDLSALFAAGPHTQHDLLAGGYVKFADSSSGMRLYVDLDGTAGPGGSVALATLSGVTVASIGTHDVLSA